ncbi:hypothetical protein PCI56_06740 [Plesiomonas shigelloides subsp. oncorhynchi]|nr:hypothetical protein [Plesiomonas shigelloides]
MAIPSLTRRLWLAFVLMALLTLASALVGWLSLRFVEAVEQSNTHALLPTMNIARELSEASAYELVSAQNLTGATTQQEWLAQGRMLTTQSLKISRLLAQLQALGFDTTAIEQQEARSPRCSASKARWWANALRYNFSVTAYAKRLPKPRAKLPNSLKDRPASRPPQQVQRKRGFMIWSSNISATPPCVRSISWPMWIWATLIR